MSIADEIKQSFKEGNMLTRLIYINLGIFVLINLVKVVTFLIGAADISTVVVHYLSVPSSVSQLLLQPWSLISYMFLHERFFHILFNLLWLYWFGIIFLRYFNERQLIGTYLLGGLSGAFFFILIYNLSPAFTNYLQLSVLLGASASVMAIAIAISVYVPDYSIPLILIGPVKLKYLALVFVITDILQIASSGNPGGHIAHLGGALFGYIYTIQYKKGKDRTKGINQFIDKLATMFKPRSHMRVNYRSSSDAAKNMSDEDYNQYKHVQQEEVDRILDKIAKSGYDSLTKREKEILFRMGKK